MMPLNPLRLSVGALDMSPSPLDLDLVKQHLAVDDTDSDELIESLTRAAIHWAEGAIHRSVYARSHSWVLQDFPRCDYGRLRLPRGRTQSVENIVYYSSSSSTTLTGPSSAVAGTGYREDLQDDDGGYLMPPYGADWPDVDFDNPAPVTINFTAGWTAAQVPEDVIHAMLFAVSDGFELRGSADLAVGGSAFQVREALISPYRLKRWF